MIVFTKHAREKFAVLKKHGVTVTQQQVMRAIETPEIIDHSRHPLLIGQTSFDWSRILRVVYRQAGDAKIVITFYPGRRKQYEKK